MLKVRGDLCIGCGLCVENCPRQAIMIVSATANINQNRCNQCRRCLEVCPKGAIVELVTVSREELESTIASLKFQADDIIYKIEQLQYQDNTKVK
ncbi:MAG: 4Fe-4S binding protein [Dehalococcoidales bacterium]|nr:4Fe-4S binding protein [Dehalococcoidales bacterium]